MNILYVTPHYIQKGKPETGVPHYLHRLSLSLLALGHTPMILSSGENDEHKVNDGIETWTVRTKIKWKRLFKGENFAHLKMSFLLNKKVKEIIEERNVDIIQFTSIGGMALFYYGKTPAVMRLSSYAKTYFSSLQTYDARTLYYKAELERLAAHRCNTIFAPCKVTADAFGKDCGRNVKVIETPFVNEAGELDYRYVDLHLKDKKYVLFFGTLYPEKGILIIAEILRAFLEANPDYYFVFVGEVRKINGEDSRKIIRKSAGEYVDRVFIWKALQHEQLFPIIKCAKFVVLPSLMDNFPNACIEAMHFSRIVIGTDGASFEQLIKSGYNGYLCKIGDSKDLLEKMQIVVELDEKTIQRMQINAHRTTLRLQPEYTVRKLLDLYEYVIRKTKKCSGGKKK